VFLDPHGWRLNGFFLLRGDSAKLDALVASDDGDTSDAGPSCNLNNRVVRGVTVTWSRIELTCGIKLIPS